MTDGAQVLDPPPSRDVSDLAEFGYRQRLDRTLGGFSSFAAGFSYLSVLTGLPQLFYLGFGSGGPAFFWTWPTVLAGQALVALCFAELAAEYPLSGGVYQWARRVGPSAVGWMAGWVYLACSAVSLASVALALQGVLPELVPACQWVGQANQPVDAARNAVLLGSVLIGLSTLINLIGVRLLARINNVGVFAEMAGAVILIVMLGLHARRGPGVVLETLGHGRDLPMGYLGPFLAAALVPSFVMYGFDTAGSLAEETDDPRRRAPRSILGSLAAVGLVGALLILTALQAAPDLTDPNLGRLGGGMATIIQESLGSTWGRLLLADVVLAIGVCTLTVHASAVRLVFAMARDGGLPGSTALSAMPERVRTPRLPALLLGVVAGVILLVNLNFPRVVEVLASVAIAWANLAYLLVTVPMLVRRIGQGSAKPGVKGRFHLGRWGLPINAIAVVWGLLMVLNVGWPRPEVYGPEWYRRFGALIATLAMLGVGGLVYSRFGRRESVVPEEHRAPEFESERVSGRLVGDGGAIEW